MNAAQGEQLSVRRLCELAKVSRATFYRYCMEEQPNEAEMALRDAIQRLSLAHRFYGYRRIAALLQREGWAVGAKKVRRLMREDNLCAARRRRYVLTTDSAHRFLVYPNLARRLVVTQINQLWVADLTYVRLSREFIYLAVVLDAFSRRVIGWATAPSLRGELTLAALDRAIEARAPEPGLVHHSDRGCQYASHLYVERLESIGATLSMSQPASPWENGYCESFLHTLKKEEIDGRSYQDLAEFNRSMENFLEEIYNRVRLHSALGYQSPVEFESSNTPASWAPAALSFSRHAEIYPDGDPDPAPSAS